LKSEHIFNNSDPHFIADLDRLFLVLPPAFEEAHYIDQTQQLAEQSQANPEHR
jgi:hypothetical protein